MLQAIDKPTDNGALKKDIRVLNTAAATKRSHVAGQTVCEPKGCLWIHLEATYSEAFLAFFAVGEACNNRDRYTV